MRLHNRAKELSFRVFSALDTLDLHVLPKHYYSPVPDHTWLRRNRHLWSGRLGLHGIEWDLDDQLRWLTQICGPYYDEVRGLEGFNKATGQEWGPGFGPIESQVLHCVIRSIAPRRIVEIGSGVSTASMLSASAMNQQEGRTPAELVCIEPFPRPAFRRLIAGKEGLRHVAEPCQSAPLTLFDELEAGDVLFIDSSHSVKTGSDVMRIYLELLPRLRPGVLIHIHDVFLPYAYPRDTLHTYFGWQETALLAALLTGNRRFRICACLSGLHYDRRTELRNILSNYRPQDDTDGLQAGKDGHFPSSLWLLTCNA